LALRSRQKGARIGGEAEGSKKKTGARLPDFVAPQLATLVEAAPPGEGWLHEIKYDGYRAIVSIAGGRVVIRTRNGLDWTERFQPLVGPLAKLPCDSALLDGEIAVADENGHTDFGALQDTLSQGGANFGFYIFDLLHLDGADLRKQPLVERKRKLKALLEGVKSPLSFSDHIEEEGEKVFARACDLRLEGIVSKRMDDPYVSGRTKSWLKTKCGEEQEFVIIGWRPSDKAGRPFRSILLAVHEKGALRYAGRVGTGYTGARLDALSAAFKKHARESPPVNDVPRAIARHARFLDPVLVAEIAFRGWTRDGLIRQGSFKGLRGDKPAREIIREKAMPKASTGQKSNEKEEIEGVRLTHPDRVLFSDEGITKRDLVDYYLEIADLMLPHIAGRPLALVRCPRGSDQKCFFQKHASPGWPDLFKKVRIKEKSGTDDYLYIDDTAGLVAAAQMDILELHIWGCHVDKVEQPDRLVFDFDPGEGVDFGAVREGARELRGRLQALGLESFPLATGGKGIHVVVPLARKHSWNEHRAFAEAMARLMAEDSPARYVANMAKAKRRGKIYVDFMRNQRGSTAIAPYSTRARKGAYVALPLAWNALSRLADAHPAGVNDAAKLVRAGDPWKGYAKLRQALPLSKLKIK
jgi:bifunctional non-homologous end joining protein LigD